MKDQFEKNFTEAEPTCPGGGKMNWVVRVEEPRAHLGECTAFIAIDEQSSEDADNKDSLLLDIKAAEWLMGTLYDAIVQAKQAEARARAKNTKSA